MMRTGSGAAQPLSSVVPHMEEGALLEAQTDPRVLDGLPEAFKAYWPRATPDRFSI